MGARQDHGAEAEGNGAYLAGLLLGAVLAAVFELRPAIRRTVTPFTVGNAELGPERGHEIEVGFDGAWFDVPGGIAGPYVRYDQMHDDWPQASSVVELADALTNLP